MAAITSAKLRAIAYVSRSSVIGVRLPVLADVGYRLDWATPVDMFPADLPHRNGRAQRG